MANRFKALNLYDRSAIDGSVLKIEDEIRDPETGKQRQLWCLPTSAKLLSLRARS